MDKFYLVLYDEANKETFLSDHPEIDVSSSLNNFPNMLVAFGESVEEFATYSEIKTCYNASKAEAKHIPESVAEPTTLTSNFTMRIPAATENGSEYANMTHIKHTGMKDELSPNTYGLAINDTSNNVDATYTNYWTGKNIDIFILDPGSSFGSGSNSIFPSDHPNFDDLDNPGNTRYRRVNWSLYDSGLSSTNKGTNQTLQTGTETHFAIHASGCANVSCGIYSGFAKRANIYGMQYNSASTIAEILNAIISWNSAKPVNSETGFKNPTILTNSWGQPYDLQGFLNFDNITSVVKNGVATNRPGTTWNSDYSAFVDAGIIPVSAMQSDDRVPYDGLFFPYQNEDINPSVRDTEVLANLFATAWDAGITNFMSAGNYPLAVGSEETESNNYVVWEAGLGNYERQITTRNINMFRNDGFTDLDRSALHPTNPENIYYHGFRSRIHYWIPQNKRIVVGALNTSGVHYFIEAYTARGPGVDLYAHATATWSGYASEDGSLTYNDGFEWRMFSGTSSACPVTAGMAACYAEYFYHKNNRYPTPSELKSLLIDNALDGVIRDDPPESNWSETDVNWDQETPNTFLIDGVQASQVIGRYPFSSTSIGEGWYKSGSRFNQWANSSSNSASPITLAGNLYQLDPFFNKGYTHVSLMLGNGNNKVLYMPDEIRLTGNEDPPPPPAGGGGTNEDSGPGIYRVKGSGGNIKNGITLKFNS